MVSNKPAVPDPRSGNYNLTIREIPAAALVLARDGRITACNSAAELLLGQTPLQGRLFADLVMPEMRQQAEAVITGRRTGCAMRMRRRDGRPCWTQVEAAPAPGDGSIMVLHDITDLKLREEDLCKGREQAEQEVQARMRFFASASHDLRQPLQAMALFVSALENHVATPQAKTIFSSLKVSLKSMEEMFESLLDMSRLDAGVLKANSEPIMMGDILERLETEFEAPAQQAQIRLRVLPSSEAVLSDVAMLSRILRNFVSNAIRYTRAGGKVLVGCRRRGGALRVEVWDTGIGIPADQLHEIFEEFYQGKTGEKRKGSGLGLAIVQRLARLLGHRLDVRSTEGRGSIFAVEVPLSDTGGGLSLDNEVGFEARDVAGAMLLVVDDDREILDAIRLLAQEWGVSAVTATTPEEALDRLSAAGAKPDLILADYKLRVAEGGVSAIRAMKAALGDDIPAFVFTGSTGIGAVEIGEGYPVLRKPLQPELLKTVLADAMELK